MIKGLEYFKNKFNIHSREMISLGLERIQSFLNRIGNPQDQLKAIHIAGTNGKGSTLQFIRGIFLEAGYEVGTFTSPAILNVNDQISTKMGPISNLELEETISQLLNVVGDKYELEVLTDFELLTVLAIFYFAKIRQQELVILETGMGGLEDSTNVITPMLSVITNIGLDHTHILGPTYEEIAYAKAGIIKLGKPVMTGVKREDALRVIQVQAEKMEAPLFKINKDFTIDDHTTLPKGERFSLKSTFGHLEGLEISLIGAHQTENAALAVMTALQLNEKGMYAINEQHIRTGISKVSWPGRFEILSENPLVVIDGAHNDEGITALVHELNQRFGDRKIHIVFAALKDKSLEKMIGKLDGVADSITFVTFDYPRAASAGTLFEISQHENKLVGENWKQVITDKLIHVGDDSALVITGSLYFISEIKSFFHKK